MVDISPLWGKWEVRQLTFPKVSIGFPDPSPYWKWSWYHKSFPDSHHHPLKKDIHFIRSKPRYDVVPLESPIQLENPTLKFWVPYYPSTIPLSVRLPATVGRTKVLSGYTSVVNVRLPYIVPRLPCQIPCSTDTRWIPVVHTRSLKSLVPSSNDFGNSFPESPQWLTSRT